MTSARPPAALAVLVTLVSLHSRAEPLLNGHPVRLDGEGKLLSWVEPQSGAYAELMRLPMEFLKTRVPVESNGLRTYFTYSFFEPPQMRGHPLTMVSQPAGQNAMFVDSGLAWHQFSGDRGVLELTRETIDYMLAHGLTPAGGAWPGVPYSTGEPGALEYRGGGYEVGGYLESDKVAEIGVGLLRFFQFTEDERYRQAAIACADALAQNVRQGDDTHSPWPFRVHAETGAVMEEYTAHVIPAIRLFDELVRRGWGDVAAYGVARQRAWDWMMRYPMQNNLWQAYFEDVYPTPQVGDSLNQYQPMETARYLLEHPELDPDWRVHVPALLRWVEDTFGGDVSDPAQPGLQYGARVISEQFLDMNKMGSHTSRFASIQAGWYAASGDEAAKEKAFRSFNWASYLSDEQGLVGAGVDGIDYWWYSDGYGDFVRHFAWGLGQIPQWAPPHEAHLLRSSSVVQQIAYAVDEVSWRTFDDHGTAVLRLPRRVAGATAGEGALERRDALGEDGYTEEATPEGDYIVRLQYAGARDLRLSLEPGEAGGCGCSAGAAGPAVLLLPLARFLRRKPANGGAARRLPARSA